MNRSLAVFAVLLLGCASWLLLQGGQPSEIEEPFVKESLSQGAESPDERLAAFGHEQDVDEPVDGQRTQAGVREVLVLGPDEQPLEGVEICFHPLSQEELEFARGRDVLNNRRDFLFGEYRKTVRSDEGGVVEVPISGAGLVAARHQSMIGMELFSAPSATDTGPVILRLASYRSLLVEVVHPDGKPAMGAYVSTGWQTAELAQASPGSVVDTPNSQGSLGDAYETDRDGQAWIDLDRVERSLEEVTIQNPMFRVVAGYGREVNAEVPFELGQSEPVRITLPGSGYVEIKLNDYPMYTVPVLHVVDDAGGFERFRGSLRSELRPTEDGAWRFVGVPLDQRFLVAFSRRVVRDSGSSSGSVQLPTQRILGPLLQGEVVRAEFTFERKAELTGTLRRENGEVPKEIRRVSKRFEAMAMRENAEGDRLWNFMIEVSPDGDFEARPETWLNHDGFSLSEFSEFLILTPHPDGPEGLSNRSDLKEWVRVPLNVPEGETHHDLGDLVVSWRDPLVTFQCVDESGQPIEDVDLRVTRECEWDGEMRWRPVEGFKLRRFKSWTGGWAHVFGFTAEAVERSTQVPVRHTGRYRVHASHQDYLSKEVEFTPTADPFVITLEKGRSISGVVRVPRALTNAMVFAVLTGSEYVPESESGVKVESIARAAVGYRNLTDLTRGQDGVEVSFKLTPLGDETVDLVFVIGDHGKEIYRIENLTPVGEMDYPGVIDLMPHLDSYQVEVYAMNGQRVTFEGNPGVQLRYLGMWGESSFAAMNILFDDLFHVFVPRGVTPNEAIVQQGARRVLLSSLDPGLSVVRLTKAQPTSFRFSVPAHYPDGSRVNLSIEGLAATARLTPPSDGELTLTLQGPGTYRARWERYGMSGPPKKRFVQQFEITDAMLDAGPVIVLPVPEELLQ